MKLSHRMVLVASLALNVLLLASAVSSLTLAGAQEQSRYFPETGHYVKGAFLRYWNEHGGLAQQGLPLTEEFNEKSILDGKTYTVQYFERAVFEKHPENQPPYDVLLSQLGKFELDSRYPGDSNPAAVKQPSPISTATSTRTATPTRTPTPLPTDTPAPTATALVATMSVDVCRNALELRGQTSWFCMSSPGGDYIGQGRNWIYPHVSFKPQFYGNGGVQFYFTPDTFWMASFAPGQGKQLIPGVYLNAMRDPFNGDSPGLDISGDGRGCNQLSGKFEVLQFNYDAASGTINTFAANFEQRCENNMPPLQGEIRYNSAVQP
jgi:hypothetical protein